MGGDNVFPYAPNPTGWIDPLGLAADVILFDSENVKSLILGSKHIPYTRNAFVVAAHSNQMLIRDVVNVKKVEGRDGKIDTAGKFDQRFSNNTEWNLA